ncbi:tripartite tricarboxylate transporter TctB family protein [Paenibacillus sp. J2TS4]|uniref:tripartite tricarboxylate transporter TctB family protein n=1 Tax=Paenibacillus sp. J2TS4 TaxID=2807194 RepID=UPI001B156439|nr:tripartite tricarboxylate transporter TctB family protein [Paenibacillus sp. J2TS4]GIP36118.1 hypothetical protein J2TS4_53280 [Paenibacillus sp. J2TS4]
MNNVRKERYSALCLFLFGLMLWLYIPYDIKVEDSLSSIGPEFFPKFIAVAVMALSAVLVLKTFTRKKPQQDKEQPRRSEDESSGSTRKWAAPVVFLLMLIYVFTVEWLGYFITTVVVMSLILWVLSSRKWVHYAVLIVFIFIIQYVFENVMYVQLP